MQKIPGFNKYRKDISKTKLRLKCLQGSVNFGVNHVK